MRTSGVAQACCCSSNGSLRIFQGGGLSNGSLGLERQQRVQARLCTWANIRPPTAAGSFELALM